MEGILVTVCLFLGKAGVVATVIAIMTRLINIWIRAWSGKEEIL